MRLEHDRLLSDPRPTADRSPPSIWGRDCITQARLDSAAVAVGHLEAKPGGPGADSCDAVVVSATPSDHLVPPLALGLLAGGTGGKRLDRIDRLSVDLEVRYRRECQMCL